MLFVRIEVSFRVSTWDNVSVDCLSVTIFVRTIHHGVFDTHKTKKLQVFLKALDRVTGHDDMPSKSIDAITFYPPKIADV